MTQIRLCSPSRMRRCSLLYHEGKGCHEMSSKVWDFDIISWSMNLTLSTVGISRVVPIRQP